MARRGRHGKSPKRLSGTLGPFLFIGGVLLAAIAGTIALAFTLGPDQRGVVAPASTPTFGGVGRYARDGSVIPTPGGSGRPSSIKNPKPWEYDPISNQHWHEPHWHWHHGPPPPPGQRF